MVWLDKCCICQKKNNPKIFNSFTILDHAYRSYIICGNKNCKLEMHDIVNNFELKNRIFSNFKIIKNIQDINIPRTNGTISIGEIKYEKNLDNTLLFYYNNNPLITTNFKILDKLYSKDVEYNELAKVNCHLPLIKITSHDGKDKMIKRKFQKFQKEFTNQLLLINKATRLIIFSHLKEEQTLFYKLPEELIKVIIAYYFNLNS